MKNHSAINLFGFLFFLGLAGWASAEAGLVKKAILYKASGGYIHTKGMRVVDSLVKDFGARYGWEILEIDTNEFNHEIFDDSAALAKYQLIVWNNCTHIQKTLETNQQNNIEAWFNNDGKIFALHALADHNCDNNCEWEWFSSILYDKKGKGGTGEGMLVLDEEANGHPTAKSFPSEGETMAWEEWYNHANVRGREGVQVILSLDDSRSPSIETSLGDHPISWVREFDGGTFFYTSLGHSDKVFENPAAGNHLLDVLDWFNGTHSTSMVRGAPEKQRGKTKSFFGMQNQGFLFQFNEAGEEELIDIKGKNWGEWKKKPN